MATYRVPTADRMRQLGAALGAACRAGDVIALVGDLGAGKTTFTQGLAQGLGVPADTPVTSPTFTLVNEHRGGRVPLVHVDLYRIERESELEHVGVWDLYRGEQVVAVEWFDRFPQAAPKEYLELRLWPAPGGGDVREVEAIAHGASGERLRAAFERAAGDQGVEAAR
jgi:tRNA threonylcarbamoyladenosine biosynthesis protein TsaE